MAIKIGTQQLTIEPLCQDHLGKGVFLCGHANVEKHFNHSAMSEMKQGYNRTFVVHKSGDSEVIGFYTCKMQRYTASEHAKHFKTAYGIDKLSNKFSATEHVVPGYYIMYLGVKHESQRQGIGSYLLIDAIGRLERCASWVGGRFITVLPVPEDPAKKKELVNLYEKVGFSLASDFPCLMIYTLVDAPKKQRIENI